MCFACFKYVPFYVKTNLWYLYALHNHNIFKNHFLNLYPWWWFKYGLKYVGYALSHQIILDLKLSGNCSDGKLNKNKCNSESFEMQQEIGHKQTFFFPIWVKNVFTHYPLPLWRHNGVVYIMLGQCSSAILFLRKDKTVTLWGHKVARVWRCYSDSNEDLPFQRFVTHILTLHKPYCREAGKYKIYILM